jgi:hypothetical protein
MPDEEIGGAKGMGKLVETKEFKDMNVGFALDEGSYIYRSNKQFCCCSSLMYDTYRFGITNQ